MGAESGREQTYQWMLRAVGALLDEEPSCRISLAEVPDGFLVRRQGALNQLEPKLVLVDWHALHERLEQLAQQRKRMPIRHHQGVWSHFPNGHQDFFRALGCELDQASARGILIDEVADGLVVTYSCPDPDTGAWHKRLVILGLPEIEEVLNAAFARRQNG